MKYEETLAIYDHIVAASKNFTRKGKTMPYTSANGYMFSLINKDGEFGIRLPPAVGKTFMEKHNTGEFRSHGAKMKDYVLIPESLLSDHKLLADTLQQGFEFVMSLPPK